MISQTNPAAMQNIKGSCCSLIAFAVQTQLHGEERHRDAEVNLIRPLHHPPFQFGHPSGNNTFLYLE
jgi:hypothetical protein